MSIVSVRAALEAKLNGMTPSLPISWENVPYIPVAGTAYQACYLLPATPDNPTLGDGFYREIGIFQISLMYPLLTGSAAAAARAELIRQTFKRGTTVVSWYDYFFMIKVMVAGTPEIGSGRIDGDRWSIPVKIRWFADIFV